MTFMARRSVVKHCASAALACSLLAVPCLGAEMLGDGDWRLRWDNTVTYGLQIRTGKRDARLIGPNQFAEVLLPRLQGTAFSSNADDASLNYDPGITSNLVRWTTEVEVRHKNWFGVFVRGRAFYDVENSDGLRDRFDYQKAIETKSDEFLPLSDAALDRVGRNVELLDAFAWFDWSFGRVPFQFRLGEQVLGWGESALIPSGIGAINPVDVSKLYAPGADSRDSLLPMGLAWLSFSPSRSTSIEVYYQYDWDETGLAPAGTFFSTEDYLGPGATRFQLGFGNEAAPDLGSCLFDGGTLSCDPLFTDPNDDLNDFHETFLAVLRGPDRVPRDGGEYGLAFRVFAPRLRGAEFGFFYANHHSRLPILGTTSGTNQAVSTSRNAFRFFARAPGVTPQQANGLAIDAYVTCTICSGPNTTSYFLEYPEDIELFGASFTTSFGRSTVQAEFSRRQDVPLQIDEVEVILAALSPIAFNPAVRQGQLGRVGTNQVVTGYIRRDVTQAQAAWTQGLGRILRADASVVVAEAALYKAHDLPAKDVLRLEGPGTFTSGDPRQAASPNPANPTFPLGGIHQGKPAEPASAFADPDSWGYRLAGRLEYDNAIGAIGLQPHLAWQHDVDGVSPGPGGPFREDRKAVTVGLGGTYRGQWEADISWTSFFGADRWNLLADRDFVSAAVKYSF